jgi:hypothetical protein
MSLRKSLTLTPALLAANRRNARKSTGPRTTRGKAQARLKGLGRGPRSRFYYDFMMLLMETPPDELHKTVQTILTPEEADSSLFKGLIRTIQQADFELVMDLRKAYRMGGGKGDFNADVRSRNVIENKGRHPEYPAMWLKNKQVGRFFTICL